MGFIIKVEVEQKTREVGAAERKSCRDRARVLKAAS